MEVTVGHGKPRCSGSTGVKDSKGWPTIVFVCKLVVCKLKELLGPGGSGTLEEAAMLGLACSGLSAAAAGIAAVPTTAKELHVCEVSVNEDFDSGDKPDEEGGLAASWTIGALVDGGESVASLPVESR